MSGLRFRSGKECGSPIRRGLRALLVWLAVLVLVFLGSERIGVAAETTEGLGEEIAAPAQDVETLLIQGSRSRYLPVEGPLPAFTVDELEIERAVPEVLTDALRGVGSIHMQSTTAGQGSPFLRGLTGSGVLSLVDGMRLNNAIYRSAPNPYLDLVDAHLVQRVDVVRGPASVRYGSDAMGGVVAVETRQPLFDEEDWSFGGRLAGLFVSPNLARGVRAEIATGREGFGFRAGFSGLATSDLKGGGDTGRQHPTAFESVGGDAAWVWSPDPGQSFEAQIQFMKQPDTPRYDELVPGYGQTEPSSLVFQYQPLERLFAHVGYEIESPAPGVSTLEFDIAYQRIRDDRETRDFQGIGSAYLYREQNSSELLGLTLAARSQPTDWIEVHWGADAYLDWVSSTRSQQTVTTGVVVPAPPRFPNGSRMNTYGIHADLTAEIYPGWVANGGIRFSYSDTEIVLPEGSQFNPNRDVTGAIGLSWSPSPGLSLIGSFRRGFRAPNVFDLGTLGPRPGNRFNIPTSELAPEIIYTYDLGVSYSSDVVEVEVFGFYSSYEDKIASVLRDDLPLVDGRVVVQSANEKLMRLAGVEGSIQIRLTSDIWFEAEAFYTWGEQEVFGGPVEPADRIPPFQGRIGIGYQPRPWIWIEPYLRFAARQDRLSDRDLQDPRINPNGTPGWVTLGIRTQWAWNDHIDLILELRNLTNADYREHGSGYPAPGAGIASRLELTF